jgi:hypothetical protein
MPSRSGDTYFDVYDGIIANHYLKVLSAAIEDGSPEELSRLDALGEYFLQDLERVTKGQLQGLTFLDKNIARAEHESVMQAVQMFHFDLTLDNLSRLREICKKSAESRKIDNADYGFLKQFLECIQKYSYFIRPAVALPQPVKPG